MELKFKPNLYVRGQFFLFVFFFLLYKFVSASKYQSSMNFAEQSLSIGKRVLMLGYFLFLFLMSMTLSTQPHRPSQNLDDPKGDKEIYGFLRLSPASLRIK